MSHLKCEICHKKINEPLYWADPKFYDIPKKYSFVAPNAQLFTMKKLKICSKIPKNIKLLVMTILHSCF
jgi:hypothetical protein